MENVQTLRIEEAKHSLESTAQRIEQIGEGLGYLDPPSFRRLFRRLTGIAPGQYRRRFQRLALPG